MDGILELLSRGGEELLGRASGPLRFRLLVMPTVVVILAIRAHLRDVRAGKPVLVGAFITSPTERRRLLRSAFRDIGKVLIMAVVLDTTYQLLVLRTFHPGQALIVAVVCAVVPYVLVRGPVTRLWHYLRRRRGGGTDATAAATKADAEEHEKQE
jgi:hypothetical protein